MGEGRQEEPPDPEGAALAAVMAFLHRYEVPGAAEVFWNECAVDASRAVLAALAGWAVDESGIPRKLEAVECGYPWACPIADDGLFRLAGGPQ